MSESIEPKREIAVADVRLTLLGTAHVSRASEEEVRALLQSGEYDAVAVELDTDRRAEIYAELQRLLYDEPMWLIGAQEGVTLAHRDWLKGFQMQPLWPRPSLKFALFDK